MSESIQDKQEILQVIFDSIPAMIFFKDRENRIIHVNKAFSELMGLSPDEMQGKTCFELWPDTAQSYWQDDKEVMESGRPKRGIIEKLKISDRTIWVQTDKIPHREQDGRIIGVIGFSVDITERKRALDLLAERNQELERMNDIMVGRELRMIEIKKEIALLKKRLEIYENQD